MTELALRKPVAKKKHKCEWCGQLIQPGERYSRVVGIYDSNFHSTPFHQECEEACQEYCETEDDVFDPWLMVRGLPMHIDEQGP